LVEEEDSVEDSGRDCDELAAATDTAGAPVDPEDAGRAKAFSFAPDEDEAGMLDSLGEWYTCGGGGPTCPYRSQPRYHPLASSRLPHFGPKWP